MKTRVEEQMFSEKVLNIPQTPRPVRFCGTEEYKVQTMHFAMNAGMEITKGGRLFSCWIGGEDGPESYMVVTFSDDYGETWKDIQVVLDPRSDELPYSLNTHVGGFWRDPENRLWLFYQQSLGMWDGAGSVFAMVCDDPDAKELVWNEPFRITPGAVIKKPIVMANGEWLLPVSIWERWHMSEPLGDIHHEYDNIRGSNVFVSKNKGKTWEYRGGLIFKDSCFNEHSVAELSDGRILMISRCNEVTKKSYSTDFGKTWSEEEEYFKHIVNWSSMATIFKLSSGNLLLIRNGDEMDKPAWGRSRLSAFVSCDDGGTWTKGFLLDERDGVSYPDVCQAEDGTIFVQYDYKRSEKAEILFAKFTEEDVLAGRDVSHNVALCQVITNLEGIKGTKNELFLGATDNFDGGDGSEENPYIISSPEQFTYFAKQVYKGETYENTYFLQGCDIDFGGRELVGVGTFDGVFCGVYDGAGHSISGFKMIGAHITKRAVFGNVCGGTIKNVNIKNAYINGKDNVAAVAGCAKDGAIIENCTAESSVTVVSYKNFGGIVGSADGGVTIRDCTTYAKIKAPRTTGGEKICAGGIVGLTEGTKIKNCVNKGSVSAIYANEISIGGIVGEASAGEITACENTSTVSVSFAVGEAFLGGIGGKLRNVKTAECRNAGKVLAEEAENVQIQ